MVSLGEAVAAIALSIGFAALGLGPYSLVLPAPIAAAARVAALWLIARPRIGSGGRRRWRLLLPAASASLGTRLLTIVMGQADYVVLGLVVREVEVGIYYFAYRLAIQSLRMIAGSLSAVLFPALVRYRDDPLRQMQAALVASQVLAVVVMPACLLQAALAGPALELFFAAKWQGAEPIIQLLSIGFAFDASSWAAGALLSARGEFGRGFTYMRRAATVFFAAITLGALAHGAIGVATAVAAYYVVVQPLYCFFVFARVGRVGWRDIAAIYAAPALVGAVAVLAPTLALATLHAPAWFQLCAVPPVAAAIYLPAIRLFCPKAYGLLRDQALGSRVRSAIA
jgi:PST family polysaccharide transporter